MDRCARPRERRRRRDAGRRVKRVKGRIFVTALACPHNMRSQISKPAGCDGLPMSSPAASTAASNAGSQLGSKFFETATWSIVGRVRSRASYV